MNTELSIDEQRMLDSILDYIPNKAEFYINKIYSLEILISKYPSLKKNSEGNIFGYDLKYQQEVESLNQAFKNIATFLVNNDFAEKDDRFVTASVESIKLTDKGRQLKKNRSLNYYIGWEQRKKAAKENAEILVEDYYQSQIDFHNEMRKSQTKQDALIDSQLAANSLSETTNVLITIFTGAAAIYYLREIAKGILLDYFPFSPDHIDRLNKCTATLLNFFTVFIVCLGIIYVLRKYRVQQQTKNQELS